MKFKLKLINVEYLPEQEIEADDTNEAEEKVIDLWNEGNIPVSSSEVKITGISPELFTVFNQTDGIYASPEELTAEEADKFIADFPKRFEHQGYYLTKNWDRIPPKDVRLVKYPALEVENLAYLLNGKLPKKETLEEIINKLQSERNTVLTDELEYRRGTLERDGYTVNDISDFERVIDKLDQDEYQSMAYVNGSVRTLDMAIRIIQEYLV